MPFIEPWRREAIDKRGLACLGSIQPGDKCYAFYKPMVERWRMAPRWSTAHYLYMDMVKWFETRDENTEEAAVAYRLAWEVFFNLHVMPYELNKRKENGDI